MLPGCSERIVLAHFSLSLLSPSLIIFNVSISHACAYDQLQSDPDNEDILCIASQHHIKDLPDNDKYN